MHETPHYGIKVDATAEYVPAQSNPAENRFAFAYHITLSNTGTIAARLMTRHWIITNGTGSVEEVRGDGVVGEQPTLGPGEQYRYTSGAILATPVGSMHGSYEMVAVDGHRFNARISAFTLAVPNILN